MSPGRHEALVDQPSAAPTRKVTAVGTTAGAATVLVFLAHRLVGYQLDPELAALAVGAVSAVAGYIVKERRARGGIPPGNGKRRYAPPDAGFVDLGPVLQVLMIVFLVVAILILVQQLA